MGRIFQTFAFILLAAGMPAFAAVKGEPLPGRKPAAEQQNSQPSATTEQRLERLEKELADARYQRDIAQIHSDLIDRQTSWYEIWTGALIGCFSLLVTVLLVAFSLRFGRQAVQEAKAAATADLDQERQEVRGLLEEAKAAVSQIRADQEEIRQITDSLVAGQAPKDAKERGSLREIATEALKKPSRERSAAEYRALIVVAFMDDDFETMLQHAQAMELLFADDAKAGTGDGSTAEDIVFAMFSIAYALGQLNRNEQSIAAYDELLDRFGSSEVPALQESVAMALFNKGVRLGQLDQSENAIAVYDDVIARFGSSEVPALKERVAKALVNKGFRLGQLDRYEDAIRVYSDVVARFESSALLTLQEQVAKALVNKGGVLGQLHQLEDAIAVCDDVFARFGLSEQPSLQEQVAMALFNKGVLLGKLDRSEDAIAVYSDVAARLASSELPALQEQAAKSLVCKAITLGQLGRSEDEIAAYDEVLSRFGSSEVPALRERVAVALVNKGGVLGQLGRPEDAIAVFDEVFARFGASPLPALQEMVADALFNKACAFAKLSRVADCISALEQWRDRSGTLDCASIADDSDFDAVRGDPQFIAFLAENGCAPPPKPKRQRKPRKPSA